jgi:hypothetical protein
MPRLPQDDQEVMKEVMSRAFSKGDTVSLWDFADAIEYQLEPQTPDESRKVLPHDSKKVFGELIERFRRQQDAREQKIALEYKRKEDAEVRECTFEPTVMENPFYKDVKSRFRNSPVRRSEPSQHKTADEAFFETLRHFRSQDSCSPEQYDVDLSDRVIRRLEEADDFYPEFRDQMAQVRAYHADLLKMPASIQ